jgi:peptidyl-dipeptidase Dcp
MRRDAASEGAVRTAAPRGGNPLEEVWTGPFGLPPFATIAPEHFAPAFVAAMEGHRSEIDAIAGAAAKPTFDNTITALEASGRQLERVADVFFNLAAAHTSEALQEVEREIAPKLAAHRNAVLLDARLFARIDYLHARRDGIGLDA